ncbi:MAG TPA: iron-containing alcohol dehydrogenase [Chloroflexota bacterium]|nr:iron-containing alcohol dehydrogenase [Chloroflexota bacterium]
MRFQYTSHAQHVVFGAGELANLGAHLGRVAGGRVILCTSGSYVRNGTLTRVREALGERLVAIFDGVRPHVPETTVAAAVALAMEAKAEVVIGLGGGSALGTAKAVSAALHEGTAGGYGRASSRTDQPPIALVAIPTTYAGSEMTPLYGVTRSAEDRKVTTTDARVLPALVLYDPELTLELPPEVTAGTGVNALAHCIEGVYSTTRSPVSTATALAGIEVIRRALPRCVVTGRDVEVRTQMLSGAYLAGTTIAHAALAIHHGLCHVLGGTAGVPHGAANSIMLPHAMRFNLPVCSAELSRVARALGIDTAGLSDEAAAAAAVDAVAALIHGLGMPQRLRDAGVAADDLPRLAALALKSAAVRANPRRVTAAAQVEGILQAAW